MNAGAGVYRVVVADDEPLVRERLRSLLAEEPRLVLAAEAVDGVDALDLVRSLRPDVLFLDIQMPGLTGFEVLSALEDPRPAVVFVTAFDQFALRAFDDHPVDYLLKPIQRDRFATAVARTLDRLDGNRARSQTTEALDSACADADAPMERFVIRSRGQFHFVSVESVIRIRSDQNYLRIIVEGGEELVRGTLTAVEERLPPHFVRVHRSHIINTLHVEAIRPLGHGEYSILTRDGGVVRASRSYTEAVRALLR